MGCLALIVLVCASDIELSPGSEKIDYLHNLSLYHWNLNNIAAQNYPNLTLLQADEIQF